MAHTVLGLKKLKVTKTYNDFATAGLTNDISLFSLPAGASILDVYANVTTAFSGGAIATYTISVGISGSFIKYLIANSVTSTGALSAAATKGASLTTPGTSNIEDFTTATSIRAKAISTVANLSAATQGSIDFYIIYFDVV